MPINKRKIWWQRSLYLLLLATILGSAGLSLYEYGFSGILSPDSSLFAADRILNLLLSGLLLGYLVLAIREITHVFPKIIYGICALISLLTAVDYLSGFSLSEWLGFQSELFIKLTKLATLALLVLEFSRNLVWLNRLNLGPGLVLVLVFGFLISVGTLLLMLPNATHNSIAPVDAFFVTVSAVCITGLSTLDVGATFTPYGQFVLMLLFQLGGLGIMTVTSFFAYFFRGGADYQNQIYLKEFVQSSQLNSLFLLIRKIIAITLTIELVSAVMVYFSMYGFSAFPDSEKIFHAVFHAVSAFCNAGFTLYPDSLHSPELRTNFGMHWVIAATFIMGSLGFGVIDNLLRYLMTGIRKRIRAILYDERERKSSWIIGTNTKLVLWSTVILSLTGTAALLIMESGNTLGGYQWTERISIAFFTATTPRSAGLTVSDTGSMGAAALFMIIFLMWIGGGPGSTAGGIKLTTFSLALLSTIQLARGKKRVIVFNREISMHSILRCLAVIVLLLFGIGLTLFCLLLTDAQHGFLPLFFEAVSGFCTVGMSMGITPDLSSGGKIILCIAMFTGRLGLLTILISILRQINVENYNYPKEEVFIN